MPSYRAPGFIQVGSGTQEFSAKRLQVSFEDRMEMLRRALKDAGLEGRIVLSEVEQTLGGESVTARTVAHLPGKDWVWVIGEDQLESLHRWHHMPQLLTDKVQFMVVPRPRSSLPQHGESELASQRVCPKMIAVARRLGLLASDHELSVLSLAPQTTRYTTCQGFRMLLFDVPIAHVSSTQIREHFAHADGDEASRPQNSPQILSYLAASVRKYIVHKGLYRSASSQCQHPHQEK